MKLSEVRISEIVKKIVDITESPCELSHMSKLIIFKYKGIEGYLNVDMADYYIRENKLQRYFDAIELLEPKDE